MFYFFFLHFPLSGPVLTNISLPIIPCMIVYVTNNKEPWTLNLVWSLIESRQFIGWWRGCRLGRSYITILILANSPSAPQISLPSQSGHISPSVADFLARYSDSFLLIFFICTSATAIVERCSPRGGVHGFSTLPAASHRVSSSASLQATTHTVNVLTFVNFMFGLFTHMRCSLRRLNV